MNKIQLDEKDSTLVEKYFYESESLKTILDILSKNMAETNQQLSDVFDKYSEYYKNSRASLEIAKNEVFAKYLPEIKIDVYTFDFANCELYYG